MYFLCSSIKMMARITVDEFAAYARAGAVAQEALSAIRTVLANNAVGYIINRLVSVTDCYAIETYQIKAP